MPVRADPACGALCSTATQTATRASPLLTPRRHRPQDPSLFSLLSHEKGVLLSACSPICFTLFSLFCALQELLDTYFLSATTLLSIYKGSRSPVASQTASWCASHGILSCTEFAHRWRARVIFERPIDEPSQQPSPLETRQAANRAAGASPGSHGVVQSEPGHPISAAAPCTPVRYDPHQQCRSLRSGSASRLRGGDSAVD